MQGCYNSARLQTPYINCHNLVSTLSEPYKVAARLLQPSCFRMGIVIIYSVCGIVYVTGFWKTDQDVTFFIVYISVYLTSSRKH